MASRKAKRSSGKAGAGQASASDGDLTTSPNGRQLKLSELTNSDLRRELEAIGENPGPINTSNRELYEGMITRRWRTAASIRSQESRDSGGSQSEGVSPSPRKKPRKDPKPKNASLVKDITVKGIVPAAYTPFTEDGEVNLPVIDLLVDHYLKNGIKSIFVNGTSGEALKMTMSERKIATERWIKAAAGRMIVIVQVGAPSLKDAKELASHAESAGANAIATIAPIFHKPVTISNLVTFLKEVSLSAPTLPLFLYHIPSLTNVDFRAEDVLREALGVVPNLRGVKFSADNLTDFCRCLELHDGRYQLMYGVDEQLLGALALGATAAIGSTYNYDGRLNNRLIAAFERGDIATAQKEQYRSQAAVLIMKKYGNIVGEIAAGKAIMQLIGLNMGPIRSPDTGLSTDQLKEMRKDLNEIGFFDWH